LPADIHSKTRDMNDSTKAVFLSYTAQDAAAAQRLCEALRAVGIEVWFDQSELRGGDAWDAAIRRQIKACALFMPILSRNSHERDEGYFRLEWKLAVDRSHLMAADRPFLLPVVVDDLDEPTARVPERFREVQWTRVPGGTPTPQFVAHVAELMGRAQAGIASPPVERATAATAAPAAAPPAAGAARSRGLLWAGLAALVLALAVGAGVLVKRGDRGSNVVPYSPEDRRLTFAVMPIEAPAGDAAAAEVAAATGEKVATAFEGNTLWDQVVPRRSVQEAMAKHAGFRDLGRALNVHFLIRGHVAHTPTGWAVELFAIDAESERVLETNTLRFPAEDRAPPWPDDVLFAVWDLNSAAIKREAERVASRPTESLDVRDLTFRASVAWRKDHDSNAKTAYESARALLERASALAPDDRAVIHLTATTNLCDCVNGWSKDPEEQIKIGTAAMQRYLEMDPSSPNMLSHKADLAILRGRYEDSLLISDQLLARNPRSSFGLLTKATALLRLGRPKEALAAATDVVEHYAQAWPGYYALTADIDFALGDDAKAADLSRRAIAAMSPQDLANPVSGPIMLTLAGAEARLGHADRAKQALDDFYAAVPAVRTVSATRKWIRGNADLAG
jgi:tetratricopeptide (TPR) repeat protein/TolB-like protein